MSKVNDIFFPFYIGDYLKKTQLLSCEEHGAYLLLIFTLYQSGGKIPFNLKKMARVCRLSESEFTGIWDDISPLFVVGEFVENDRVNRELEAIKARSERARKNGKSGGRPKKKPIANPEGNLEETQKKPSGLATGNPDHNLEESYSHSHSHSHSEINKEDPFSFFDVIQWAYVEKKHHSFNAFAFYEKKSNMGFMNAEKQMLPTTWKSVASTGNTKGFYPFSANTKKDHLKEIFNCIIESGGGEQQANQITMAIMRHK